MPAVVAVMLAAAMHLSSQEMTDLTQDRVVHYSASDDLADPVAALQKKISSGQATLAFEPSRGYLVSLLTALGVSAASQSLVFSKTSSQEALTSPNTPRAIYFSDTVYVGWVPGFHEIDVSAVDPKKGPIFYTLQQQAVGRPTFERRTECLRCHLGPKTSGVPGFLVRSVLTAPDGFPVAQVPDFVSGHNSPLSQRWGGWYVTGTHEHDVHLGNSTLADRSHPEAFDVNAGANVTSLRRYFDTSRYPSAHSDIVALLVLEHSVKMQNLITRASYETRLAEDDISLGDTSDWPRRRVANAGEALLQYMLFRDEAPLKGAVTGTSGYAAAFVKRGVRDSRGRSLREFDLKTRLFRYPCSFLIYSDAFDALPPQMKTYLWRRLREILSGQDRSPIYATMAPKERHAILEILRDTKPEFKLPSGPRS